MVPNDSLTKAEWFEVYLELMPGATVDDFELDWDEFYDYMTKDKIQ